ncbi:immunogenic protein MPT63 [Mycobacterium kansasii]|uniref:Immunogenic protein MPT63 n=1 Tax=Mycobacterium kansasii TaxID=1768 RepID=A0A1V3XBI8_MYCKA|nr:immunogenic protein MPT63 [Mycobacterium kansasii]
MVGKLGSELTMTDTVGQVVLSWKVSNLQPSSDETPGYQVAGKLWEATATVKAIRGSVTPAISQFNAVAPDQAAYRVLWFVSSPSNISGATIPEGAQSTGKIHFDVTGPSPTTVTMNNGMEDLMIWGHKPTSQREPEGSRSTTTSISGPTALPGPHPTGPAPS